jgi:asparagine synthase (glutamine-hydrolysing)
MCGIAGLIGLERALALPAAERMRAALRHRGPDDQGLEIVERPGGHPAVLVHTRLSIVELSAAGHQPMRDHPQDAASRPNFVTFNGEIYNHTELHEPLARAGFACRSRSDTEVILSGYRAWGTSAAERFEGMFAFCLLDVDAGRVWLCRDRVGIKPLYVFRPPGGGLLFASEVRALLAAGPELVPRRLNRAALESYFAQGAVMSEHAVLDGAELLKPGESWSLDFTGRVLERRRYWTVSFGVGADDAEPARFRSEVVAELGVALRRSLKKLLLADVPVGLFLSSGVDSSAVASIACEVSSEALRTIAIGFDVKELDETAGAALIARELGMRHERVELSGASVLAAFDDVLRATDQPTVDGFNTYFVSRAARQSGLTVALSGLGGDELFGGYRSFIDVPRALGLARLRGQSPDSRRSALLRAALRATARLPALRSRGRALAKAEEALARPAELVQLYYLRRELFSPAGRRALQALPPASDPYCGVELEALEALERAVAGRELPSQIAELEYASYMRHMLLRDTDVFSMAHGLEVRVPMLEHYAVAEAARARGRWLLPDPRPKPLLVDAVGPRLPARSWQAKKRGFTFPWGVWLAGPLRERARAALSDPIWRSSGVEPRAVENVWTRFASGDTRVSPLEVLALVVLESYLREHRLAF